MRPDPETVISMAAKIVDLKRQLSEAQVQWDAMFPEDALSSNLTNLPSQSEYRSLSPRVRKGSGVARILEALNQSPDRDFEPRRISEEMGMPLGTTRTVLSKLVKKGLIEKRGTAKYGAITKSEKEASPEEKTS